MYPDQDSPGGMPAPPQNNFDFIVNPPKKPRKGLIPGFGGGGFLPKVILLVGAAVGLIIILWIVTLIFGSGGLNVSNAVNLAQTQQEIIRVAGDSRGSIFDQDLRDASTSAEVTIITHQQQWVSALAEEGRELKKDELELKQNAETDAELETALNSGAFDTVYAGILESMLRSYGAQLETAFNQTEDTAERQMLNANYQDLALLLEQLTGEKQSTDD